MAFAKPPNLQLYEGPDKASCMFMGYDFSIPLEGGHEIVSKIAVLLVPHDTPPPSAIPDIPYFRAERPTTAVFNSYITMQSLLSRCAQSAEEVFELFRRVNYEVFGSGLNPDNKRDLSRVINTLDFMKLKNIVIDYFKDSAEHKGLVPKPFRAELEQFVLCRNIFTHGKLMVITPPGNIFCIAYIDNHSKNQEYMMVDNNTVVEYIQAFERIKLFMRGLGIVSVI